MAIRVLLVDDHAVVRDGLRALLEAQDDIFVVGDCANGREAVRETKRLHPNVVVMDIAMPDLNGIEAAQEIREAHPEVQVILLSMHATTEHLARALEAGAQGYVTKESAGKEVVEAVRCVHARRQYLSPKITALLTADYVRLRETGAVRSPLEALSSQERKILQLVAEGKSSAEIAQLVFLSVKTVETYRSRLMQKLGLGDIPSLVRFAIQHGITPLE
ncbi:MAG: response regulator transcription factor, partial [Planctomycetes bacterium]|nr:response regulator transcription factor [Planctomycetota bacterium]